MMRRTLASEHPARIALPVFNAGSGPGNAGGANLEVRVVPAPEARIDT